MSKRTANVSHSVKLTQKQQLLSEVIEQNCSYLQQITQVYVSRVIKQFGHKFGLTANRDTIETVTQEIFNDTVETALKIADKFDINRSPQAWLLGIAANKVKEWQRDQTYKSNKVVSLAELPQARQLNQQSSSDRLSDEEILGLLYQSSELSTPESQLMFEDLLSLVNDSDQEVLKLVFVDGKSGKLLAATLGITEGAAYTRKFRAIERLRKAYFQALQEQKEGK